MFNKFVKNIVNFFNKTNSRKSALHDSVEFEIPENSQYNPRITDLINNLS